MALHPGTKTAEGTPEPIRADRADRAVLESRLGAFHA